MKSQKVLTIMIALGLFYLPMSNAVFESTASSLTVEAAQTDNGIRWDLDEEGTLTISGEGEVRASGWNKNDVKKL